MDVLKTPDTNNGSEKESEIGNAGDDNQLLSKEHFRLLFDNSLTGIVLVGLDLKFRQVNKAFCKMLGYNEDELINLTFQEISHPDDRLEGKNNISKLVSGEIDSFQLGKRYLCKDGQIVWGIASVSLVRDSNNNPVHYLAQILDITDRKLAENKLREQEIQYHNLADSGRALIWLSGTDKLCYYFNKIWLDFTGRTLEQEMGNGWAEGVHPDDFQRCLDIYTSAFDRRETFSMEYRLRRFDGSYRWIIDDGSPRYNSSGEFLGYIGHCLDITERKTREEELQQERNFNKHLTETSPGGIAKLDKTGKIVFVNPRSEEILGVPKNSLNGLEFNSTKFKITDSDGNILPEEMLAFNLVKSTQKSISNAQHSIIKPNGEKIDLNINAVPLFDNQNNFDGMISSIEDITEIKKAETLLRSSEEKFKKVFLTSPDSININRLEDGMFVSINQGFTRNMGYTEKEVIGKTTIELNLWVDLTDRELLVKNLEQNGMVENFITKFRTKSGEIKYGMMSAIIIDFDGIPHLLNITRDITENKRIEKELNEARAMLKAALDQSSAGIAIAEAPDGKLRYLNDAGLLILGGSRNEIMEGVGIEQYSSSWHLVDFDGRQLNKDEVPLARAIMFGETNSKEFIIRKSHKDERFVMANATPIKNEAGEVIAGIVVFVDITARKLAEREIIKAKEKAESADKLKSEFLAQMSHEIRSPINTILNSVALLKEELHNADEEIKSIFPILDSAGSRVIKTIDSILNMSELQLGIYEPHLKEVNIQEDILNIVCAEFKHLAEMKNLEFIYTSETDKTILIVDEYSTGQIFRNLLDNAVKYTNEGSISVKIFRSESGLLSVDVMDTGVGISKEFLPTLFTPFRQEEQGYTRKYDGNGLGLALIKKYCEINNAEISVRSKKHFGTVFTIEFK